MTFTGPNWWPSFKILAGNNQFYQITIKQELNALIINKFNAKYFICSL